jgi:purine-nucleoside phosphorylase
MTNYTGRWRGHPVSVMGTGMGIPSASIATGWCEYGATRLVRIDLCGNGHRNWRHRAGAGRVHGLSQPRASAA